MKRLSIYASLACFAAAASLSVNIASSCKAESQAQQRRRLLKPRRPRPAPLRKTSTSLRLIPDGATTDSASIKPLQSEIDAIRRGADDDPAKQPKGHRYFEASIAAANEKAY